MDWQGNSYVFMFLLAIKRENIKKILKKNCSTQDFFCILIANLRLFFRGQSTLPWTYTTGAGSAAKDILDLDRETVLEIIGPGVQSGEDEFPYS